MGTFKVEIEIGDLRGESWETVEALVDTGATFTMVPRVLLERLGVTPEEKIPMQLADARTIQCDLAHTRVRIDGRVRTTLVVFGETGTEPLLGAHTLEGFLLAPDPVNRRLVPVPGLLKVKKQQWPDEAEFGLSSASCAARTPTFDPDAIREHIQVTLRNETHP